VKLTALHASIPFPVLKGSIWTNLVIDIPAILSDTFKGTTFKYIGGISMHGQFKLRKVATCKMRPTASNELPSIQSMFSKFQENPRVMDFPITVKGISVVIGKEAVDALKLVSKRMNLSTPLQISTQHSNSSINLLAFGRSFSGLSSLGIKPKERSKSTNLKSSRGSNNSIQRREELSGVKTNILPNCLPPIQSHTETESEENDYPVQDIIKRAMSFEILEDDFEKEELVEKFNPKEEEGEELLETYNESVVKCSKAIDEQSIINEEKAVNSTDTLVKKSEESLDTEEKESPDHENPIHPAPSLSPITQLEKEYNLFLQKSIQNDLVYQKENQVNQEELGTELPDALIRNLQAETSEINTFINQKEKEVYEDVSFFENGGRRIVESGCGPCDGEEEQEETVIEAIEASNMNQLKSLLVSSTSNGPGQQNSSTAQRLVEKIVAYKPETTPSITSEILSKRGGGIAPAAETPDERLEGWGDKLEISRNFFVKYVSESDRILQELEQEGDQEEEEEEEEEEEGEELER